MEAGRGNQACFLWEGNGAPVFRARTMSYREVLDETCRLVRSIVLVLMQCSMYSCQASSRADAVRRRLLHTAGLLSCRPTG